MNSRSFFLAHAQDIVGIIAILFIVVDVFDRKWVSVLLPPQGFGPEAKTKGGIIETPA